MSYIKKFRKIILNSYIINNRESATYPFSDFLHLQINNICFLKNGTLKKMTILKIENNKLVLRLIY